MRYKPRLKNGEPVQMTWPMALYRRLNPLIWPMEDNPKTSELYIERCVLVFGFLVYSLQVEADIHFLWVNRNDMDRFLTGIPVTLVQLETLLRNFHLAMNKDLLKRLLQKFYAEIFTTQQTDSHNFERIKRQMLGPRLIAIFYITTMLAFFYEPVKNMLEDRREMLYKQEYFIDNTKLPFYIPLIFLNLYVGVYIDTMLFGELNMLGEFMMHLNVRYLELGKDLRQAAADLLILDDTKNIAANYHLELIKILRRNVFLNSFANEVEKQFTFRIFLTFSFSATILCALGFICYTDPKNNIVHIVWLIAKLLELMAFGYLGSVLYQTTNELDLMYYNGDWEQIINRSDNAYDNIQLMKLITLSIELNSRPFALTGLKYFRVTLAAVLKIIQGAFSYFTFLNSIH